MLETYAQSPSHKLKPTERGIVLAFFLRWRFYRESKCFKVNSRSELWNVYDAQLKYEVVYLTDDVCSRLTKNYDVSLDIAKSKRGPTHRCIGTCRRVGKLYLFCFLKCMLIQKKISEKTQMCQRDI